MANETKAAKAETVREKERDPNELVDYTAPLLPGRKQKDIFGAVNGETFCVKRGIPVKIKRKFYEVLQNAQAQQVEAYTTMAELHKQGSKPAASM